ncbi:hypothetical protein [Sandaracinus amylolyticus]|uniref:hypothetical protein n=1 Tax=Sandaracinus amylolyticus TaxID=927083 RepID=UPI001F2B70A2|nr:hypothetical protein [Sandaracinus amylolyticus]UJR86016.1 Hypothetical protein I5071_80970 [Sandaracinus amylolyticus]
MLRSLVRALPFLVALLLMQASARAQLEGAVHLRTGFIPDPAVLEGRATATRPASELASACTGFVGTSPSHVLALDTRFGYLRLFATADVDLVLAVRTARGEWLCSDDRFGPHPAVEGIFTSGRVEVWIGGKTLGTSGDYQLRITETRSVRPGIGEASTWDEGEALARDLGLDVEATEGTHEGIRLQRGFLPDPRTIAGAAGGPIDATSLGGTCRGHISARPTHAITLRSDFDFLQLWVDAEGDREEELTLIVLTPQGRFLCDVGTREVPDVAEAAWPEGLYRVWVGTLEEDVTEPHRLGISEIRRVR